MEAFGAFVTSREAGERADYLNALAHLEVGDIGVQDDEREREALTPAVRLVNGAVKAEQRERLMLGFNTPFFPDVLIASAVMAEGVDLHLHCRHVIHHDLDWNPSTIEQRTGRLDRIGSKAELVRRPILVFEPFIEATQDEKVFRVMKDRERWFNVVMGAKLDLDEWSTDRIAGVCSCQRRRPRRSRWTSRYGGGGQPRARPQSRFRPRCQPRPRCPTAGAETA